MTTRESVRSQVDELARILDREVSVDDPHGRVVAYSAHTGAADGVRVRAILAKRATPEVEAWQQSHGIGTAREPVRIPANPELGMLARLCVPLRDAGTRNGYLWIIEHERPLDAAEHDVIAGRAARIAWLLREELHERYRGGADALRALLAGDPDATGEVAAVLGQHTPIRLIVVAGSPPDGASLRFLPRAVHYTEQARTVLAVAADGSERLAAGLAGTAATVGLSDVHSTLRTATQGYREALAAAELALLDPSLSRVQSWTELGAYRLLINTGATGEQPPSVLDTLPEAFRDTLEAYLDSGCDARTTAEQLHLHRTSLYYRLRRIAELTGRDLSSGAARLELHLGLKLARLARRARLP